MTRAQFLSQIWKKGIKPALLVVAIYFCTRFVIDVFANDGTARFTSILVVAVAFLFTVSYFIGLLFKIITAKVNAKLPENVKMLLKVTGKLIDYALPLALTIVVIRFWQTEQESMAVLVGFFLLQHIIKMVKGKTG